MSAELVGLKIVAMAMREDAWGLAIAGGCRGIPKTMTASEDLALEPASVLEIPMFTGAGQPTRSHMQQC